MWPAFKGNVTIKPCHTIVLDLNLNVQLYSLIIMQQAASSYCSLVITPNTAVGYPVITPSTAP